MKLRHITHRKQIADLEKYVSTKSTLGHQVFNQVEEPVNNSSDAVSTGVRDSHLSSSQ
jgi:hypothetical protein